MLSQLSRTCKLIPRFHLRAINYFSDRNVLDQDALEFAQYLSEQMKEKLIDSREKNAEKKQNKAKQSQQRTLPAYSKKIK